MRLTCGPRLRRCDLHSAHAFVGASARRQRVDLGVDEASVRVLPGQLLNLHVRQLQLLPRRHHLRLQLLERLQSECASAHRKNRRLAFLDVCCYDAHRECFQVNTGPLPAEENRKQILYIDTKVLNTEYSAPPLLPNAQNPTTTLTDPDS